MSTKPRTTMDGSAVFVSDGGRPERTPCWCEIQAMTRPDFQSVPCACLGPLPVKDWSGRPGILVFKPTVEAD